MKTNMLRNRLIVVLLVLFSAMQATAVDYKNRYQGQYPSYEIQSSTSVMQRATAPSADFHSTSVITLTTSAGTVEMLNDDGSVNEEAYMGGRSNAPGVRRAPNGGPGSPGGALDPTAQQPLGDAALPLALFACAYALVRMYRRKTINNSYMKKNLFMAALFLFAACAPQEAKAGDVTFDPTVRYSRIVIDNCLYHFKANTKAAGFAKYDESGSLVSSSESSRGFDYVPGLVAKAVLECVDLYQDSTWAAPWFYSIQAYGETYYNDSHDGKSLDDLNACKMYFGIYDLTKSGAKFENSTVADHCTTAKGKMMTGLTAHNTSYAISAGVVDGTNNANALPKPGGGTMDVTGGWFHKYSDYPNQLWCDGQYMGPALLAQCLADGLTLTGMTSDECWDVIVKQFDITWTYLWNSTDQLLYHAFCADGGTNETSRSSDWEGLSVGSCYHSAEYWGRAEGWYVLALVDVLEAMDKAGLSSDPRRTRLLGYLQSCAEGLIRWQDGTSGCWYQLLGHDGSFSVTDYYAKDGVSLIQSGTKSNYLESSASAIFTATLLKGIRLGYLNKATYEDAAKDAYEGFINTFLKTSIGDSNDYGLINSCASAGLGGSDKTGNKRRTGSSAYYLLGADVTKITSYTEGKVLGAFILAATEYERAYMAEAVEDPACKCLRVSIE